MPCYHKLKAFRDSDGVRVVNNGEMHNLLLACQQCWGCRIDRSQQWAIRCMHEAKSHRHNCFITVTYAPEHLPQHGSLVKRHHQLFLKRLLSAVRRQQRRKAIQHPPVGGWPFALQETSTPETQPAAPQTAVARLVRYYMAGEYGSRLQRPHYHFCIFGIDFNDRKYWGTTPAGSKLYRSPTLEKLWPFGHSTVGQLTFESAAYTARYVMKKINGQQQKEHYEKIDPTTGEIIQLQPEYNEMSRAKGIGKDWIQKYTADVYEASPGKVLINGKEVNAPRYYNNYLKKIDPDKYELIAELRYQEGRKHAADNTPARIRVREQVAQAKARNLKRSIE